MKTRPPSMQKTSIHPEILQPVFESAANAADKGQSQFFTPLPFGRALARALPKIRPTIVDLNCGAGHRLLQTSALAQTQRLLGADIDPCRGGQSVEGGALLRPVQRLRRRRSGRLRLVQRLAPNPRLRSTGRPGAPCPPQSRRHHRRNPGPRTELLCKMVVESEARIVSDWEKERRMTYTVLLLYSDLARAALKDGQQVADIGEGGDLLAGRRQTMH